MAANRKEELPELPRGAFWNMLRGPLYVPFCIRQKSK